MGRWVEGREEEGKAWVEIGIVLLAWRLAWDELMLGLRMVMEYKIL